MPPRERGERILWEQFDLVERELRILRSKLAHLEGQLQRETTAVAGEPRGRTRENAARRIQELLDSEYWIGDAR